MGSIGLPNAGFLSCPYLCGQCKLCSPIQNKHMTTKFIGTTIEWAEFTVFTFHGTIQCQKRKYIYMGIYIYRMITYTRDLKNASLVHRSQGEERELERRGMHHFFSGPSVRRILLGPGRISGPWSLYGPEKLDRH